MIEGFLLTKFQDFNQSFIRQVYTILNDEDTCHISDVLNELKCSERKLQRTFKQHFDITPKQFLRIKRFRKALSVISSHNHPQKMTALSYQLGFSDQSHFIKEIGNFTNTTPLKLGSSLNSIDEAVLVAV